MSRTDHLRHDLALMVQALLVQEGWTFCLTTKLATALGLSTYQASTAYRIQMEALMARQLPARHSDVLQALARALLVSRSTTELCTRTPATEPVLALELLQWQEEGQDYYQIVPLVPEKVKAS